MAQPQVGAQLIVFGERNRTDFAGVLKAVAKAGYDGYEGGTITSEEQLQQALSAREAAGLACTACHTGIDQLADAEKVKTFIHYTKAIGTKYLITSGRGDWKTVDEYLTAGKLLNEVGKRCCDAGVTLCYHNHHWEFKQIDGQTPFYLMLMATDPKLVQLCPDVFWVHVGGAVPVEFISCYRERIPYFHFKDGVTKGEKIEFRELGQGSVDLPAALKAALTTNPEWIVIEQDNSKLDPAESVKVSREYLKSLGL